jgi:hypothetical protein
MRPLSMHYGRQAFQDQRDAFMGSPVADVRILSVSRFRCIDLLNFINGKTCSYLYVRTSLHKHVPPATDSFV